MKEFAPIQVTQDTQVKVMLKEYKGNRYVDIRQWWKPEDKEGYLPTKKGITISISDTLDHIQEFRNQINALCELLEQQND